MSKTELWKVYTDKNPQFVSGETVTMTTAGLKKLFDQTYDQAFEHGKAVAEKTKGVFDGMFGGAR